LGNVAQFFNAKALPKPGTIDLVMASVGSVPKVYPEKILHEVIQLAPLFNNP
jgi:hypothetical protein